MRNACRVALVGSLIVGMSCLAGTAQATPGSGVSSTLLAQKTVGGKDYILREVTVQPGGSTGWHYHDGTLHALVEQGTLTHSDANCRTDGVYRAGSTINEPSGADNVHLGRNLGTRPVVMKVLYIDPAGSPLSQDAANPGCDFQ